MTENEINPLIEVADRLRRADNELRAMAYAAAEVGRHDEVMRLTGKRSGVRLALSYVEEMTR